VTITGFGQSELDDYVSDAAKKQGRYVMPDPDAHNGMYFRSDHFSFARRGVPGLFAKGCSDHAEHGKAWARRKMVEYWTRHYHQPSDEYDSETADFAGLVADTKLLFDVGLKLAMESAFPAWKEGSEFKALREKN
jgi:Zn-dependent M28 family amino/carboxypeptidase